MAGRSRYDINNQTAGILNGVLKNELQLKNQSAIDDAETLLLKDSYEYFLELITKEKTDFTLSFLFKIHKYFLGPLYTWAGTPRRVNISKDGFLFAPAEHLNKALIDFEKILKQNKILKTDSKKEIAQKLAIIHSEFNVIHPFREGNGRTIRLFIDLIAVKNGYNLINYRGVTNAKYIKACIAGLNQNYKPLTTILYKGLRKTKTAHK